jgi:hypothetical protein
MHGAGQESAVPERLTKGKRKGEKKEAGRKRRVRYERAGKTTGEHDSVERFGRGSWAGGKGERCCGVDVRVAEEAEVDREEEGKVPTWEMGRAVRQPARCGERGEARWKAAGVEKTRRAEVERWG